MPAPAFVPRTRRSATILLTSSALAVAGLITGCDSDSARADKNLSEALTAAEAKSGADAAQAYQAASQTQGASPAATAHAKTLLAQAKVEQARQTMGDLERNELEIARLVAEISDIAIQIQTNNAIVAGYKELAPKGTDALGKLLESERTQISGKGPGDKWKVGKDAELPALSNANGVASKLSPQVKALEGKRAGLVKQREAFEVAAADSLRESKRKTGKESVELFKKSAEASKKSADVATQIAGLDHQLLKLRQELALAQAQSKQLDATVKSLGERLGQNKKSAEELQNLIKAHQDLSRQLVAGDGESAPAAAAPATGESGGGGAQSTIVTNVSMSAKAKELAELAAQTDAKRKAAIDLLTAALGHLESAGGDLQKARSEIEKYSRDSAVNQLPQAAAWKASLAIYSPASVNLQKANVQQLLASLHRDALASLANRRKMLTMVGPILKDAEIEAPAELASGDLDAQFQETLKAATEAYDASDALLQEIAEGGSTDETTRNAAQTAQVVALYGRAQLLTAAGDTAGADQAMSRAKQTVTTGTMPAEQYPEFVRVSLGMKVEAPTTAPAPAPAPAPDAAPATAPTTAPVNLFEGSATTEPAATQPATAPTGG